MTNQRSQTQVETQSDFYEILENRTNLWRPADHWLPGLDQTGWEKDKRQLGVMETFCILPVVAVPGCICVRNHKTVHLNEVLLHVD